MANAEPHGHEHNYHHAYAHGVARDRDRRYLTIALLPLLGIMPVEVVAGIIAKSLAPISDGGHPRTDVDAIGLGLLAMRL